MEYLGYCAEFEGASALLTRKAGGWAEVSSTVSQPHGDAEDEMKNRNVGPSSQSVTASVFI
jgi:hypothetical protein